MKKLGLELNFDSIRQRIEKIKSDYKPGVWARKVGVSRNVVANVHGVTRQRPSLEYIIAVSMATGKSVDYFLWGENSKTVKSTPPKIAERLPKVVIEHQDIIKGFDDPVLGKDLNQELILIQDTDTSLFNSTVQSIKAAGNMARALKTAKGQTGIPATEEVMRNGMSRKNKEQRGEGDTRKDGTNGK